MCELCSYKSKELANNSFEGNFFLKINKLFVKNGMPILNMLKVGYIYCEEAYVMMQENQRIATQHHVTKYTREIGEFKVQQISYPQTSRRLRIHC